MSVTLHQIQEFYCGALKDATHTEESIHMLMYSLFGVMSTPTKTEENPRVYWTGRDPQAMCLIDKALLCLGMMIEVLPAEFNVIPYTIGFVTEAISSWSPPTRKAACLAITVIADSEQADKECLQKLLPLVMAGIMDGHPVVRNAGLCALVQFNLNKQINLQHYCDELLVPLLHCLKLSSEPLKTPSITNPPSLPPYIGVLLDTVVSLCIEKDKPIEERTYGTFLSKIVKYLLLIVNASCDINFRERAINSVKEIVRISKKESVFYVHRFAKFLRTFLENRPTEKVRNILVSLLEIFEIMQKNLAREDFQPLAKKCFQFILAGIKIFNDRPTLIRAKILLAKLDVLLEEEMNKNVVLQIVHVDKTNVEGRPDDEQLPVSYGFGSGLHKESLEHSVSVNKEIFSTASPHLTVQEGQLIANNTNDFSNKCVDINTTSLVSSDVDKISLVKNEPTEMNGKAMSDDEHLASDTVFPHVHKDTNGLSAVIINSVEERDKNEHFATSDNEIKTKSESIFRKDNRASGRKRERRSRIDSSSPSSSRRRRRQSSVSSSSGSRSRWRSTTTRKRSKHEYSPRRRRSPIYHRESWRIIEEGVANGTVIIVDTISSATTRSDLFHTIACNDVKIPVPPKTSFDILLSKAKEVSYRKRKLPVLHESEISH